MTEVLLLLFFLLLLYYVIFMTGIYKGLNKNQKPGAALPPEFVSVIVPFRNEAENIYRNLCSLEAQDYPPDKYEIIYVNDFSTDEGPQILEKNISGNNVRMLNLPDSPFQNAHKKRGIGYGIRNARGGIIVTTDADCIHNKQWLNTMMRCYDDNTAMVAGPVELNSCATSFQKIQKLEFAGLIIIGAGLIGAGNPIICNAANLSYRKKLFNELHGFDDNLHLSSGDDELLMQKISSETNYQIKFCNQKEAAVHTNPCKNLADFFLQRRRWASKGLYYKDKSIVFKLFLIFLFYAGLAVQAVLSFFAPVFLLSFVFSFLIKALAEYIILKKGFRTIFSKPDFTYFIPAEILHIPYIVIMSLSGAAGNFRWKGRKLKR